MGDEEQSQVETKQLEIKSDVPVSNYKTSYDNGYMYDVINNAKLRRQQKLKNTYEKLRNDGPTYDPVFNRKLMNSRSKIKTGAIDRFNDMVKFNVEMKKNKQLDLFKVGPTVKTKFNPKDAITEQTKTKNEVIKEVNSGDITDNEDFGKIATDIIQNVLGDNKRLKTKQRLNVRDAVFSDVPERFKTPEQALKFAKSLGDEIAGDDYDDDSEGEQNVDEKKPIIENKDDKPAFKEEGMEFKIKNRTREENILFNNLEKLEEEENKILELAKTIGVTKGDVEKLNKEMQEIDKKIGHTFRLDLMKQDDFEKHTDYYNKNKSKQFTNDIKTKIMDALYGGNIPEDVKKKINDMNIKEFIKNYEENYNYVTDKSNKNVDFTLNEYESLINNSKNIDKDISNEFNKNSIVTYDYILYTIIKNSVINNDEIRYILKNNKIIRDNLDKYINDINDESVKVKPKFEDIVKDLFIENTYNELGLEIDPSRDFKLYSFNALGTHKNGLYYDILLNLNDDNFINDKFFNLFKKDVTYIDKKDFNKILAKYLNIDSIKLINLEKSKQFNDIINDILRKINNKLSNVEGQIINITQDKKQKKKIKNEDDEDNEDDVFGNKNKNLELELYKYPTIPKNLLDSSFASDFESEFFNAESDTESKPTTPTKQVQNTPQIQHYYESPIKKIPWDNNNSIKAKAVDIVNMINNILNSPNKKLTKMEQRVYDKAINIQQKGNKGTLSEDTEDDIRILYNTLNDDNGNFKTKLMDHKEREQLQDDSKVFAKVDKVLDKIKKENQSLEKDELFDTLVMHINENKKNTTKVDKNDIIKADNRYGLYDNYYMKK